MTPAQRQRVEELYDQLAGLPADERTARLLELCSDDTDVRAEVESLLRARSQVTAVAQTGLEEQLQAALETVQSPTGVDQRPQRIGPYHILALLGTGGMGEVYKAEQRSPIRRTVAIKIIKLGFDSREVIARFESERQALARMDHPNVARVLDAGVSDTGRPYFVMEYVPGKPITQFCDDNKLSIKERLLLFTQACDAISHAHTKAIIHRDIKAANVLAFLHDGKPTVKVIDFGIAKALTGDRLTDATFNTDAGRIIGTYDSMSPEQAEGSPDIDTRTDVYSLGVLLYELLTGAKPFDHETLARAADHEIKRMICEVEPPRPSTRLSTLGKDAARIAMRRQLKLDDLARDLRRELEWVPLMAMRKERHRRYASSLMLAQDIQNYLQGQPLVAGPDSRTYWLRKWVSRHRIGLGTLAAILILVIGGTIIYVSAIRTEQRRTGEALTEARHQKTLADSQATAAELASRQAQRASAASDARYLIQQRQLPGAMRRATEAYELGGRWEDGLLLDEIRAASRTDWTLVQRIVLPSAAYNGCIAHAGEQRYLVTAEAGGLRAFDAFSGEELGTFPLAEHVRLLKPATPSAAVVVAVSGRTARLLELPSLAIRAERTFPKVITSADTSDKLAVLMETDGRTHVLDLTRFDEQETLEWPNTPEVKGLVPWEIALSPFGSRVLRHGGDWGHPAILNELAALPATRQATTAPTVISWVPSWGRTPAFVDENTYLFWYSMRKDGSSNDQLNFWEIGREKKLGVKSFSTADTKGRIALQAWRNSNGDAVAGLVGSLGCMFLYPQLSDGDDPGIRYDALWPLAEGGEASALAWDLHRGLVVLRDGLQLLVFRHEERDPGACAAFCDAGLLRASVSPAGELRVALEDHKTGRVIRHTLSTPKKYSNNGLWCIASTPDASTLVVVMLQGKPIALVYRVPAWDQPRAISLLASYELNVPTPRVKWQADRVLSLAPDGNSFVVWSSAGAASRFALPGGTPLPFPMMDGRVCTSSDGKLIGGLDSQAGEFVVADTMSGAEVYRRPNSPGVRRACFTSDGESLVFALDGQLQRANLQTGVADGPPLTSDLLPLAISHDGTHLVAFRSERVEGRGSIVLAEMSTGRVVALLDPGGEPASRAFYTPDGSCVLLDSTWWVSGIRRSLSATQLRTALMATEKPLAQILAKRFATSPSVGRLKPTAATSESGAGIAIAADNLPALRAQLGGVCSVEGLVENISYTQKKDALNIEFTGPSATRVIVWVPPNSLPLLEGLLGGDIESALVGHRLRIRGTLHRYGGKRLDWKGRLQITFEDPNQIAIDPREG